MKLKKIFFRALAILLGIVLAAVCVIYLRARTKPVLDDAARRRAPGAFVRLNDGMVHYEIAGNPTAPSVVLIHGSSAPFIIFDKTIHALADSGYRVLRYDMFGRGYSDRPRIKYGRSLYVRQFAQLVEAVGIRMPLHVLGLSMGGAIAVSIADSMPEKIASLILISPAGPYINQISPVRHIERLTDRIQTLVNPIDSSSVSHIEVIEPLMPAIKEQFKYRGTEWATYSFLKNRNAKRLKQSYENVGKQPRPGLIIWGKKDKVLPFEFAEKVYAYMPRYRVCPIPGAGHVSHFERPDTVNAIIADFLNEVSAPATDRSAIDLPAR